MLFFHTGLQASDRPANPLELRLFIADEIEENPDKYKGFVGSAVLENEMWTDENEVEILQMEQLRKHIRAIKQPGVWGGHTEITAFVEQYPGYYVVVIKNDQVHSIHRSTRQGGTAGFTRPSYALHQVLFG